MSAASDQTKQWLILLFLFTVTEESKLQDRIQIEVGSLVAAIFCAITLSLVEVAVRT